MLIPLGILSSSGGGGGNALTLISTTLISSNTSTLTFSSIPSIYKHLQIRFTARSANAETIANWLMRMNGDTGGNYAMHWLRGNGSDVSSGNLYAGYTSIQIQNARTGSAATANAFAAGIIDIADYSNSSKNKVTKTLSGSAGSSINAIWLQSGLWLDTSAITSLTLFVAGGDNFVAGSRFSLYGVS